MGYKSVQAISRKKQLMNEHIKKIYQLLSGYRFVISNEKSVQLEMEQLFINNNIPYRREPHLDSINIPDFILDDGLCIEVKIKGAKRAIYNQCLRYSEFEDVKSILLVTSVNTGLPPELNGKKTYILNLSRAWL